MIGGFILDSEGKTKAATGSVNVILAFKLQKAYFHANGSNYLGERADTLKVRILDYFKKLDLSNNVIYFIREVRSPGDNFFRCQKTHSVVGSIDVDIVEVFKPYLKLIINVSRYNAFYKTMLEAELVRLKPDKVFMIGLNTSDSILFTAEELRNRGYNTKVIEPLTMSEDDYLQSLGIVLLKNMLCVDVEKGV